MKDHRYILHTENPHGSRRRVWDSRESTGLGHPARFILKQQSRSQFILVDLISNQEHLLSWKQLADGVALNGFDPVDSDFSVRLSPLTTPPAAFRSQNEEVRNHGQLYVYRSIAQWLIQAEPISSAYVGFKRGSPSFSLVSSQGPDGSSFRIRALSPGGRLKVRGGALKILRPSEEIRLNATELSEAIFVAGSHSWRFGFVETGSAAHLQLPIPESDPDSVWAKGSWLLALSLLFGFFSLIWWKQGEFFREQTDLVPQKEYKVVAEVTQAIRQKPLSHPTLVPMTVTEIPQPATKPILKTEVQSPKASVQKPVTLPPRPQAIELAKPTQKVATQPPGAKLPAPLPHTTGPSTADLSALQSLVDQSLSQTTDLKTKALHARKNSENGKYLAADGAPSGPITHAKVPLTEVDVKSVGDSGVAGGGYTSQTSTKEESNSGVNLLKSDFLLAGSEAVTVDEGLSRDQVSEVIRANIREVRYCYEQASRKFPKIHGKLVLSFVIGPNGKVQQAKVRSSDITETGIDQCVVGRLWAWQFPKPQGGNAVSVEFPFVFRTLGNREVQW